MTNIAASTLDTNATHYAKLLNEELRNVECNRSAYVFSQTVADKALLRKQIDALCAALYVARHPRKLLEDRQSMLLPATAKTRLHQAKTDLNKVIAAVFYADAEKSWEDTWMSGDPLWNS